MPWQLDAILKSPYKAVDEQDLTAVLGKQPLEAMVQANLLALRPYSFWAEDIDAAAFGVNLDATVVTAPTPLHLHLMERRAQHHPGSRAHAAGGWERCGC